MFIFLIRDNKNENKKGYLHNENRRKELKNKILHIIQKNILTNGTYNVIFTYEKEVVIWKLIIK